MEGQLSFKSSVEWVSELRDTLAVIHQAAHDNEQAFKEKSKAAYDKGAQARSFKARDQVYIYIYIYIYVCVLTQGHIHIQSFDPAKGRCS